MLRVMDDFDIKVLRNEAIAAERSKWFIAAKQQKDQRAIHQEEAEAELAELAVSVVLADLIQLEAFRADLDTYDALTIEAIMENQIILDQLRDEYQDMLENSHQLEDGTRVFKSRDGKRVYNEEGEELSPDIVHPDEIADRHTKSEDLQERKTLIRKHERIQENLHDYQEKLDAARERLDSGELTQDEFDELKENIEQDMPIEVRRKLPDYDPSQETDLTSEFTATAALEHAAKLSPAEMAIDPSMMPGLR